MHREDLSGEFVGGGVCDDVDDCFGFVLLNDDGMEEAAVLMRGYNDFCKTSC